MKTSKICNFFTFLHFRPLVLVVTLLAFLQFDHTAVRALGRHLVDAGASRRIDQF